MSDYSTPEKPIQLNFDSEDIQKKKKRYYNVNAPIKLKKKLFISLPTGNDNYSTPPPMSINYDIPPPITDNNIEYINNDDDNDISLPINVISKALFN